MHGQHIRSMDRQINSEEDTFLRQSRGDPKGETESEIIPAQDQALHIKYHVTKILQKSTDSKCRLCKKSDEIEEHIISYAQYWKKEQQIKRCDRVCAQLLFNICKKIGAKLDNTRWYDHVPKSVETSHEGKVTISWNKQVQSDRTNPNNKLDIIISDN